MYTASAVNGLLAGWKSAGVSKPRIVKNLAEACLGWPYVFGAAGEMCTVANREKFIGYNPGYADNIRAACPVLSPGNIHFCDSCKWVDTRIFDCRGFTRWLLSQVEVPLTGGGATSQWETTSNWAARGTIDTIPRELVCCLFKRKDGKMSHTGMHLSGGNIIHCSTTVKTDTLPGRPTWTHWGVPAGLYTVDELRAAGLNVDEKQNTPTLRKGNEGDLVKQLQTRLNELTNAGLAVDGKFGTRTESAVIHFQELNGLTADGIVGPKTWAALNAASAPEPAPLPEPTPAPDDQALTITVPLVDWNGLRAAVLAAYHIIKRYEG